MAAQPIRAGAVLAGAAQPSASGDAGSGIAVSAIRIEDGRVTWHGGEGDARAAILDLDAEAPSQDEPIHVSARLGFGGVPLSVDGEVGSWSGLQDFDRKTPWPVRLALTAADAHGPSRAA